MQNNSEIKNLSTNVPRGTPNKNSFITKICTLLPGLSQSGAEKLFIHYGILLKWNKTHNLTRIVSDEDALNKHYIDSLVPLLTLPAPKSIADLGSGTGLPGFAAAALWPETRIVLVETVAKKCSFMRAVAAALENKNIQVIKGRVEKIEALEVDLLITRATFPWQKVPAYSARHIKKGGQLLAYIGKEEPSTTLWENLCTNEGLSEAQIKSYTLAKTQFERHLGLARK